MIWPWHLPTRAPKSFRILPHGSEKGMVVPFRQALLLLGAVCAAADSASVLNWALRTARDTALNWEATAQRDLRWTPSSHALSKSVAKSVAPAASRITQAAKISRIGRINWAKAARVAIITRLSPLRPGAQHLKAGSTAVGVVSSRPPHALVHMGTWLRAHSTFLGARLAPFGQISAGQWMLLAMGTGAVYGSVREMPKVYVSVRETLTPLLHEWNATMVREVAAAKIRALPRVVKASAAKAVSETARLQAHVKADEVKNAQVSHKMADETTTSDDDKYHILYLGSTINFALVAWLAVSTMNRRRRTRNAVKLQTAARGLLSRRLKNLHVQARVIENRCRGLFARLTRKHALEAARRMQASARRLFARRKVDQVRAWTLERRLAATRLQASVRCMLCERTYAKNRDALTLVQSAARRRIAVRNYDEARDALRLVQSAARRSIAVRTRKSSLRAVLRTQAAARRFLAFAHDQSPGHNKVAMYRKLSLERQASAKLYVERDAQAAEISKLHEMLGQLQQEVGSKTMMVETPSQEQVMSPAREMKDIDGMKQASPADVQRLWLDDQLSHVE